MPLFYYDINNPQIYVSVKLRFTIYHLTFPCMRNYQRNRNKFSLLHYESNVDISAVQMLGLHHDIVAETKPVILPN